MVPIRSDRLFNEPFFIVGGLELTVPIIIDGLDLGQTLGVTLCDG
jgi:hypothetical protein